jgi:hypothetical protein
MPRGGAAVPATGLEAELAVSALAVFGYASLVDPLSAAHTLGRPVEIAGLARLHDYARGWTVARDNTATEKTFARSDGSVPHYCLGLNVEPADHAKPPNGVLIEVTDAELDRLDVRELRFHRTEVTDLIEPAGGFTAVFTYRARPENYRPTPPDDAIVVATYPRHVEQAFAALGPEQLELYRETTPPPPVEVTEAGLIADAIPPGNPRAW